MQIKKFEQELKQINAGFSIKSNPKILGMAGVHFKGEFLFAVPDNDIYDDVKMNYSVVGFDGRTLVHRTRPEAIGMAKTMIQRFSDDDYLDATMGTGKYSDDKLAPEPEESKIIKPLS